MERTDIHSPSKLVPQDYMFVCYEYVDTSGGNLGAIQFLLEQRRIMAEHMKATGGKYANHQHGGNCQVCGSVNAIYTVMFYHAKSNTYVRTGQECAETIDRKAADGMSVLRKYVHNAREAQKGIKKAKLLLSDANILEAWGIASRTGELPYEEGTIRDIVGKLVRYGNISDNQVAFIRKLLYQIEHRAQLEAERTAKREAEAALAAPCPTGRVTVKGEVLSVRVDDTQFGQVTKMLVKALEGYKIWSSMPAGACANKGDIIEFKVTVTPSDTDNKFGFGKRPLLVAVENKSE